MFEDGGLYRMYYRGSQVDYTPGEMTNHHQVTCYAESADGIRWEKPSLGLVEFEGSKDNNIIWDGTGSPQLHAVQGPEPRLRSGRGVQSGRRGAQRTPRLQVGGRDSMVAHDRRARHHQGRLRLPEPGVLGLRQGRVQGIPPRLPRRRGRMGQPRRARHQDVGLQGLPELAGPGVAQVLAGPPSASSTPTRSSRTTAPRTSSSASRPGTRTGAGPSRRKRCRRSSTRRVRGSKSQREGTAMTDGMFMSSRDGLNFDIWPEAFIRPGLRLRENWFYGDNYQGRGLVETASRVASAADELSVYVTEATFLRLHPRQVQAVHAARRRLRIGARQAQRRTARHEAARLRRRRARPELLQLGRRRHPRRGAGQGRVRRPRVRARRLPRPVRRRPGARRLLARRMATCRPSPANRSGLRFELRDADLYSLRFRSRGVG